MTERMKWNGERKVYQPRISKERVRQLYQMKEETGQPMTRLLDEAIGWYVALRPDSIPTEERCQETFGAVPEPQN